MSRSQDAPQSPISVVGGVYRERCLHPNWDEVFGSAGRAVSVIRALGPEAELHAYFDASTKRLMEMRSVSEGFSLRPTPIDVAIAFDYVHGLAKPKFQTPKVAQPPISVTAENIVRFGMLEGDALVDGRRVVYDPQNQHDPRPFSENGSSAQELALVLNLSEARVLSGHQSGEPKDLAEALVKEQGAKVVVIKMGPRGAVVHDGNTTHSIPAYRSDCVWKIGSGDHFAAHFAYRWMHEGRSPAKAADLASMATANYCQSRAMPTLDILNEFNPIPITPSSSFLTGRQPVIYLAGPFFTLSQLWLVTQAWGDLSAAGLKVFSPYHDVGRGSANDVAPKDLKGLDEADLVFAIGDGMDPGTTFEVGYARKQDKPVVFYCENENDEAKKMIVGSGCQVRNDYVSAVYEAIWQACEL